MTRFNPKNNQKSPEEWSAIALQNNSSSSLQYTTIGGILLALWVGSSAGVIPGLLVLAWTIYSNIATAKKSSKNYDVIVEDGAIAHCLNERDFSNYRRQIGDEQLKEELLFIKDSGLSVPCHAQAFLEEIEKPDISENLVKQYQSVLEPPEKSEEEFLDKLTNSLDNSLFIGLPCAGKGMLTSNLIREFKKKIPNLRVFVIDPKADYREIGYWDGVADVYKRRKCENMPPVMVVEWVGEQFSAFDDFHQERSLLVLDEGYLVGNKAKIAKSSLLQDKLVSLDSAGSSSGRHIWVMSQTPYVGGLGIDLSASSLLKPYAIVHKDNLATLQQWSRATVISPIDSSSANQMIEASESDRIVFTPQKARWEPLPILKNYSGYNRDKREYQPETQKLIEEYKKSGLPPDKFLEEIGCPQEAIPIYKKILS